MDFVFTGASWNYGDGAKELATLTNAMQCVAHWNFERAACSVGTLVDKAKLRALFNRALHTRLGTHNSVVSDFPRWNVGS